MFEGFKQSMIDTGDAVIRVRHGGKGPPLLLLHGIPQTHVMWHRIAPRLAQDFTVVAADLQLFLASMPDGWSVTANVFPEEVRVEYARSFRDPKTLHAICEEYRAATTLDHELDEADRGRRRIRCPVLALWSRQGPLQGWYDVLSVWREWADDVRGRALDCGHFLPEEAPAETYGDLHTSFTT